MTPQLAQAPAIHAAQSEATNTPKLIDWYGVTLTLPAKLPASAAFDMYDMRIDGDADLDVAVVGIVRDVLGPEQWKAARKAASDADASFESFGDLLTSVLEAYGMGATPGE